MPATIDHRARKRRIASKCVKLFSDVGYKEVTFQMIAVHCDIARTVLYRYFTDKRQVFDEAIREVIGRMAARYSEIARANESPAIRLRQMCALVTATLFDNRRFLRVIIEFVTDMTRAGYPMSRQVLRFTIALRRLLQSLLLEGMQSGDFRQDLDVEVHTDILYTQFESAVLRLTMSEDAVQTDVLARFDVLLRGLVK